MRRTNTDITPNKSRTEYRNKFCYDVLFGVLSTLFRCDVLLQVWTGLKDSRMSVHLRHLYFDLGIQLATAFSCLLCSALCRTRCSRCTEFITYRTICNILFHLTYTVPFTINISIYQTPYHSSRKIPFTTYHTIYQIPYYLSRTVPFTTYHTIYQIPYLLSHTVPFTLNRTIHHTTYLLPHIIPFTKYRIIYHVPSHLPHLPYHLSHNHTIYQIPYLLSHTVPFTLNRTIHHTT
jgi:hypothetical protein